ncbi:MAG: energy-coupling factor transporter transmembrane protein EcfT [Desulfurococcales archaeon]|nr:energy-coupling factor transporter transmembrane protein EcfT [Desulfurococcales archaeon]
MLLEELFLLFSFVTTYRDARGIAWRIDYRVKIFMVVSAWISVLYFKTLLTMVLSTVPVFIYISMTNRRLAKYVLSLSSIPAVIVFLVVVIVSPYPFASITGIIQGFRIGYKVYVMSASSMAFMTTTNPVTVSGMFRRFPRVHDYNIILARLVPLTLKDLSQVIGIQRSLGRPMHRVLFPVTVSTLRRGDELAESLYMRGYGLMSGRSIIREPIGMNIESLFQLLISMICPVISYGILHWV